MKKKQKPKLDENTLNLYNNLSTVCGIFSIGLTLTGVFGIIIGFLGICYSSMTAGLGNSLATESTEKNYSILLLMMQVLFYNFEKNV